MPDHTAISGDALGDPTGRGSSQPMPDHTAISGDTLGDPTGRAARPSRCPTAGRRGNGRQGRPAAAAIP